MSAAEHEAFRKGPPPPPHSSVGGDDAIDIEALIRGAEAAASELADARTKKRRILELYDGGTTDVAEIVMFVLTRPRTHRILETAIRPMTETSWG